MTGTNVLRHAVYVFAILTTACGALDVSDPTAVEESDVSNATGAELIRRDALGRFYLSVGSGALYGGLMADEFLDSPFESSADVQFASPWGLVDRREGVRLRDRWAESTAGIPFAQWQEVRFSSTTAIEKLRAYASEPPRTVQIGQMFAVRGYATLRLAEDICPGFGLHTVVDGKLVGGPPTTTEAAFERALADFDSAVAAAADSARILRFAQIGRARTLLGLGRFSDAAAAAAPVPTDYVLNTEFSTSSAYQPNPVAVSSFSSHAMADKEGGNGLDFVSAGDPRVQLTPMGTAPDGVTGVYAPAKYPDQSAPMVVASGLEARLIEAEAALQAGDARWLTILNDLRATQASPGMAALSDPGTPDARLDLLFRERAFWLFGTGTRLADLRRLVRLYGRAPEHVFPTGPYRLGGEYGTATSLPFAAKLEAVVNPAVTGCTS